VQDRPPEQCATLRSRGRGAASCGSVRLLRYPITGIDTPFSWTKQVASHFGGVRQGMAISWPKVIKDKGGIRNQFHHVIDIVPTPAVLRRQVAIFFGRVLV
jgi:arylsulfatase A-like enzyme